MSTYKQACIDFLKSHKVSSVAAPAAVIEIDSKEALLPAFQKLMDGKIQSAPVYDSEAKQYIGFLDIRDLISFLVFVYDEGFVTDDHTLNRIVEDGTKKVAPPGTAGVNIRYLARRNRFIPVYADDNLWRVSEVLADGVHRVPVIGEDGKVVNIISQSTVVRLLHNSLASVADDTTIASLGLGTAPVLTVAHDDNVIHVFRLMNSHNISGVAIVNGETNRMVGTTTGKDTRLFLRRPTLAALNTTILENLQLIRDEDVDERNPAIGVFDYDHLKRVVGLLAVTRVHRVFVMKSEEEYIPKSVISITDFLRYLRG